MSKITDKIEKIALPVVEEAGCELWDVEYVHEAGTWFLRIYLDKEDGISINDCETVSRALDPILDEEDPIPDSYVFEVSSAGCDRIIRKPEHYAKCIGKTVDVKLYKPLNGRKTIVGALEEYSNGDIKIIEAEEVIELKKNEIAQTRLHVEI